MQSNNIKLYINVYVCIKYWYVTCNMEGRREEIVTNRGALQLHCIVRRAREQQVVTCNHPLPLVYPACGGDPSLSLSLSLLSPSFPSLATSLSVAACDIRRPFLSLSLSLYLSFSSLHPSRRRSLLTAVKDRYFLCRSLTTFALHVKTPLCPFPNPLTSQ